MGLSFHVLLALLAHPVGYDMQWSATVKEATDSTVFDELPAIFKRYRVVFTACGLCIVMMLLFAFLPYMEWGECRFLVQSGVETDDSRYSHHRLGVHRPARPRRWRSLPLPLLPQVRSSHLALALSWAVADLLWHIAQQPDNHVVPLLSGDLPQGLEKLANARTCTKHTFGCT